MGIVKGTSRGSSWAGILPDLEKLPQDYDEILKKDDKHEKTKLAKKLYSHQVQCTR